LSSASGTAGGTQPRPGIDTPNENGCYNGFEPDEHGNCQPTGSAAGCSGDRPKCWNSKGDVVTAICVADNWECPDDFFFPGGANPVPTDSDGNVIDNTASGGGGGGGAGGGFEDGERKSLTSLKEQLEQIFRSALRRSAPAIPGGTSAPMDPAFQMAIDAVLKSMQDVGSSTGPAKEAATDLLDFKAPQYAHDALRDLSQHGGAPDITNALAAIRTKGMQDIEQFQAGERERFGEMGLSSGSDVAGYVAKGASMGVSDILARQESLIVNVLSAANQTRMDAATAGGQLGLGEGQIRLGAAGLLPQIAEIERMSGQNAGAMLNAIGMSRQGVTERNLERGIADFIRRSQPWLLNEASAYATGMPQPQQPPLVQGSGWQEGAGALIGALMPALIALSSRKLKDVGEEIDSETVARSLAKLPIHRWKYKGDSVSHIGPMAEDFSEAFGVGDGTTLHLADVMGVVLAVNKAVAQRATA